VTAGDRLPRRAALVAGALVIVAIAIVLTAIHWLGRSHGPVVYADLRAAPGLHEGAPVSFRGIAVGEVTRIGFADEGLRLTIALSRRDVPLRSGDAVRITPNGIFGDYSLEIVPGPASAAPLADGGVLGEALPDSAALRQRALADAFVRRLGESLRGDSAHRPATDSSAAHPPAKP
jgi:ABC-type transporter Mla subunit MlaD